jgi:cysteinyl-tRNA synthetase
MLKFHNTLTGQLEEFHPISGPVNSNEVRMYICGPTVWSYAHIGNFRTFVFGDILRRYLKFKGYNVTHVMNLTDVDDRIINEAAAAGQTIYEFTAPYTEAFWQDFDAIGNERPEIAPMATDHIAEMIAIIQKLLENGLAYESEGSIYFRVSAFPGYGKLSKINLEGNVAGGSGRVDTDKYDKENARDFALWKLVPADDATGWDASFGRGRPGWHIECSAMSMKYLGETFDIHAGGIDLQFPHHENEIAQSEGATGKLFAKYWLHGEFLKIEHETMSKSLGNVLTVHDMIEKGVNLRAARYLLFSVPYRKQLNFTLEALKAAEAAVSRLQDFRARLVEFAAPDGDNAQLSAAAATALTEFEAAMDDDLNTSVALAALHNLTREGNTALASSAVKSVDKSAVLKAIEKIDSVFNIFGSAEKEMLEADIEALIEERQAARAARDFTRSDEIRDQLLEKGIVLEDTKDGVRWKRK